jgi:hypothetical protein
MTMVTGKQLDSYVNARHAVAVLNRALEADPDAINELFTADRRPSCNEALANDPTIQVMKDPNYTGWSIGVLGLLNGIFGIREDGNGYICAIYNVECPTHGELEEFLSKEEADGLVVGDECPRCQSKIAIGRLVKFQETP